MMGIHDQALNAAAGFVPHPDELALEEVTSPKWAEEDEAFFRAGSTTYPACWKNKHSQRPQQLLPQPQESLQESRRRRGLGKLPEKRRDRLLREARQSQQAEPIANPPQSMLKPGLYLTGGQVQRLGDTPNALALNEVKRYDGAPLGGQAKEKLREPRGFGGGEHGEVLQKSMQ